MKIWTSTAHAETRLNQRGISHRMIEYALRYGEESQKSRIVFTQRDAEKRLKALQDEERLLKKIVDKGGIVVVAEGEKIITTYNFMNRHR